ncbi:MAG: hypothetical protein A2X94_10000 [Bdellovibrionales bacterium GWB1_55_8]|nr:MAG: hypothetical protein A2X94_10000 [Bdellovibrionales bacterium GWB1_55_8]
MKSFPKLEHGRPALILAPMEGVLDAALRQMYSEFGGLCFAVSEFVRVSSAPLPAKVLLEIVPELRSSESGCETPGGLPVQVQLLGSEPSYVAETALRAVQLGAGAIDLNFGCPSATVNRHGGGAVMLRDPGRICAVAEAVRHAIGPDIALSAKIRLGWQDKKEGKDAASALENAGVDWIVVHARTREQGYTGKPCWESLRQIVEESRVPVVANGDILDLESFRACELATGCAHFMIGRGALADPGLGRRLSGELRLNRADSAYSLPADFDPLQKGNWLPVFQRFSTICAARGARPEYTLRRLKQWLGWLASIHPGTREWVDPIRRTLSLAQALDS